MADPIIQLQGPQIAATPTQPFAYQEARTIFPEAKVAVGMKGIDLGAVGKAAAELGTQYVMMKHEQFAAEKQDAIDKTTAVTQSKLAHQMKMNDIDGYTRTLEQYQKDVGEVLGVDPKSDKPPAGAVWQKMWSSTRVAIAKWGADKDALVTGAQEDARVGALRSMASRFDADMARATTLGDQEAITARYQDDLVTLNKRELGGTGDIFAPNKNIISPHDFQRKAMIESEWAKAVVGIEKARGQVKPFDPKNIWDRGQAMFVATKTRRDEAEAKNKAVQEQVAAGMEVDNRLVSQAAALNTQLETDARFAVERTIQALYANGLMGNDEYDGLMANKNDWLTTEGIQRLQGYGADAPFIESMNGIVSYLASEKDASVARAAKLMKTNSENIANARTAVNELAATTAVMGIEYARTASKEKRMSLEEAQARAKGIATQFDKAIVENLATRWGSYNIDLNSIDWGNADDVNSLLARVVATNPDRAAQLVSEVIEIQKLRTQVQVKLQQLYPAESSGGGSKGPTTEQLAAQLLQTFRQGGMPTKDEMKNIGESVRLAFSQAGFKFDTSPQSPSESQQLVAWLKANPNAEIDLDFNVLMNSDLGQAVINGVIKEFNQTNAKGDPKDLHAMMVGLTKRFLSKTKAVNYGDIQNQAGQNWTTDLPESTSDPIINGLVRGENEQAMMALALSLGDPRQREQVAARLKKAALEPTIGQVQRDHLAEVADTITKYDPSTYGSPFDASKRQVFLTEDQKSVIDLFGKAVESGADPKQWDEASKMVTAQVKLAALPTGTYFRQHINEQVAIANPELKPYLDDTKNNRLMQLAIAQRFQDYMREGLKDPELLTELMKDENTDKRNAFLKGFAEKLQDEWRWDSARSQFTRRVKANEPLKFVKADRSSIAASDASHSTMSTERIALSQPLVPNEGNMAVFLSQFGSVTPDMAKKGSDGRSIVDRMVAQVGGNPIAAAVRIRLKSDRLNFDPNFAAKAATEAMGATTAADVMGLQIAISRARLGEEEPLEEFITRIVDDAQAVKQNILDNNGGSVNVEMQPFTYTNSMSKAVTYRPTDFMGEPVAYFHLADPTTRGSIRDQPWYIQSQRDMPYSVFRDSLSKAATNDQWNQRVIDWLKARPEDTVFFTLDSQDSNKDYTRQVWKKTDKDGNVTIGFHDIHRKLTRAAFFGLGDTTDRPWEIDKKYMAGPNATYEIWKGKAPPKPIEKPAERVSPDTMSYAAGAIALQDIDVPRLLRELRESQGIDVGLRTDLWKGLLRDLPEYVIKTPPSERRKLKNEFDLWQSLWRDVPPLTVPSQDMPVQEEPMPDVSGYGAALEKANQPKLPTYGDYRAMDEAKQWSKVGTGRQFDLGASLIRDIPSPFVSTQEEQPVDFNKLREAVDALNELQYPELTRVMKDMPAAPRKQLEPPPIREDRLMWLLDEMLRNAALADYVKNKL